MPEERDFDLSGAICLWQTSDSNRDRLGRGLMDLGLERYMPKPRTPKAILHSAVSSLYADKNTLVRPVEKRNAFTVVDEFRGESENDYHTRFTASVEDDGTISVSSGGRYELSQIKAEYDRVAEVVPGASVTNMLVSMMLGPGAPLRGISMRERGAVYWIPASKIDLYRELAEVVEKAACISGDNRVYLLRTMSDPASLRAIRDNLIRSLNETIAEIEKDSVNKDLGERGLEARQESLDALYRQLGEYESILGDAIEDIREKIRGAEVLVTEAILMRGAMSLIE